MPRGWCSTAAYCGPVRTEGPFLVRDEDGPVLHAQVRDSASEVHYWLYPDGTRRSAPPPRAITRDDAVVTPSMPVVRPSDPRSGQQPPDVYCDFKKSADGSWRGVARDGRRLRLQVSRDNGTYRVLGEDDDEPGRNNYGLTPVVGSALAFGGGQPDPEGGEQDNRPLWRRRAGDAWLNDAGGIHADERHSDGLRNLSQRFADFWRRKS
jgi:hypothetical protein